MIKRERRTFTGEFKKQMVQLYESETPKKDIIGEHDLIASFLCFSSQNAM